MTATVFSRRVLIGGLAGALCWALAFALPAQAADKAAEKAADKAPAKLQQVALLEKARAGYYSLQREGLAEFTCSLAPDWGKMLAGVRESDPAEAERRLKIFQQIHFQVKALIVGMIDVKHSYSGEEHPELADNMQHIYHGIEQMVTGFFDTWKGFVMVPFLPETSADFNIQKKGAQYRLTYSEGDVAVVTQLDPNLMITSTRITSSEFDSTIKPQFTRVDGGLLLSGYDGTYVGGSPATKAVIRVRIDSQVVDGFQLPGKIAVSGSDDGSAFAIDLFFTDCHATRR